MRSIMHGLLSVSLGGLLLTGCVSTPIDALKLDPQTAEQRQLQTRRFDGVSEATMLSAGLGVLQDLGFTLDSSESSLGVVSASRNLTGRRQITPGETIAGLLYTAIVPALAGPVMAYRVAAGVKEPQIVHVCLVTQPGAGQAATIRITAQRRLYQDEKHRQLLKVEPLNDPAFYREFFNRLAKSVSLEEQKS